MVTAIQVELQRHKIWKRYELYTLEIQSPRTLQPNNVTHHFNKGLSLFISVNGCLYAFSPPLIDTPNSYLCQTLKYFLKISRILLGILSSFLVASVSSSSASASFVKSRQIVTPRRLCNHISLY